MASHAKRNAVIASVIVMLIIGAVIYLGGGSFLTSGASPTNPIPALNCGLNAGSQSLNTSNLCKAMQIGSGGTITSLSQVQYDTSSGVLSGPVFLVNLVVNGAMQQLTGTVSQVQQALSAQGANYNTSNPSRQIAISYGLVNESYFIPYTSTGQNVELWGYAINYVSYNPPQAGLGGAECGGSFNSTDNTYALACWPNFNPFSQVPPKFISNMTAFAQACSSATGNRGIIAIINTSSEPFLFIPNQVEKASFQCLTPVGTPFVTQINQPSGTKYVYANVSFTYSNGTSTTTGYLSNYRTSLNLNNNLYAQLYGYSYSGSDILGASLPFLLQRTQQTPAGPLITWYPISQQNFAAILADGYPASQQFTGSILGGLYSFPNGISSAVIPNVYALSAVQTNINTENAKVVSYIQTMPSSNFYYGSIINPSSPSGLLIPLYNSTGYNPKLGAVPWLPEIQLIAKVSSLGLYVPAPGEPAITNIQPSPFSLKSGTQGTLYVSVQNVGNSTAPFYVTVSYSGMTFGGMGSQMPIAVGNSYTFAIPLTAITTQVNVTSQATISACSTAIGSSCVSKSFQIKTVEQCPASGVPINSNTCQPLTTISTTTTIPQQQGEGVQISWGELVIVIIAVMAIGIVSYSYYRKTHRRRRRR